MAGRSNMITAPITAHNMGLSQLHEMEIGRASSKKIGLKKTKKEFREVVVKQVVEKSSLILTIQDLFTSFVQVCNNLRNWGRKNINKMRQLNFSKGIAQATIPFTFLWGLLSIYSIGNDARELSKAYKKKDHEKVRDRGLSLGANGTNLAASGLSAAVGIKKARGIVTAGSSMSIAATALGVAAYTIYLVIQSIGLFRSKRALAPLERTFKPGRVSKGNRLEKVDSYKIALKELCTKVYLTKKEEAKIQKKTGDYSFGEAFKKVAKIALERKEAKLKRRVGEKVFTSIKKNSSEILHDLESKKGTVRQKAYFEAEKLLNSYKGQLYKDIAIRALKIAGSVLGVLGAAASLATPLGAAIFSGILVMGSAAVMLYAWRGEKAWKSKSFEKGITLFGRVYNTIEVPSAKDIIEEEIMMKWKNEPKKYKVAAGQKSFLDLCEEFAKMPKEKKVEPAFYEKFISGASRFTAEAKKRTTQVYNYVAEAA